MNLFLASCTTGPIKLAPDLEQVGPGAFATVVIAGPPSRLVGALLGFIGLNFVLRVVNPALDALGIGVKKRIRSWFNRPKDWGSGASHTRYAGTRHGSPHTTSEDRKLTGPMHLRRRPAKTARSTSAG